MITSRKRCCFDFDWIPDFEPGQKREEGRIPSCSTRRRRWLKTSSGPPRLPVFARLWKSAKFVKINSRTTSYILCDHFVKFRQTFSEFRKNSAGCRFQKRWRVGLRKVSGNTRRRAGEARGGARRGEACRGRQLRGRYSQCPAEFRSIF